MYKLALLGKNISHSQSPSLYRQLLKGTVDYKLFDFQSDSEIPSLKSLFSDGLMGLSVTSPYKKHFLRDVKILESEEAFEAINCIRLGNEVFEATNTDYLALRDILNNLFATTSYSRTVLMGSGSMAEISEKILTKLNVSYIHMTRSSHGDLKNVDLSSQVKGKTLVLNACSRDMYFSGKLSSDTTFFDFNYDMKHAISIPNLAATVDYIDGLNLLYLQAKYALDFWGLS